MSKGEHGVKSSLLTGPLMQSSSGHTADLDLMSVRGGAGGFEGGVCQGLAYVLKGSLRLCVEQTWGIEST